MDSIILALAIKLYKKLLSFIIDYQSDTFGVGGKSVYIGTNDDDTPTGFERWQPQSGNTYLLGSSTLPQFENLTIGRGCAFTTASSPYLFLYVRDTLHIQVGGRLHLDSHGDNTYTYSPFMPQPGIGGSTNSYTAACLRLLLSGRDIRTNLDLSVMGGNANTVRLSGGGTVGGGGGLVCLYHKADCFKAYNVDTQSYIDYSPDFVTANGGATGAQGGGMLFVFARNIIIETDNSTNHGYISANGGDGQGIVSYIDSNPGDRTSTGQMGSNFGGGGVVHHTALDVI